MQAFKYRQLWNKPLHCQLRSVTHAQADGRLVRLEAGDRPRFTSLRSDIDSLTDTHSDGLGFELFVEGDEEAWVYREREVVNALYVDGKELIADDVRELKLKGEDLAGVS